MSDLEAFRQEVSEWLEENCPPSMRTPLVPEEEVWGGRNAQYVNPESKLWLERMGDKGWTAIRGLCLYRPGKQVMRLTAVKVHGFIKQNLITQGHRAAMPGMMPT